MFEIGKRYRAENGSIWEITELNINPSGQMRGLRISSISPSEKDQCDYIPETTLKFHWNGSASGGYTLQPEPVEYLSETELRAVFDLFSTQLTNNGNVIKLENDQHPFREENSEFSYWCHLENLSVSIHAKSLFELFKRVANFKPETIGE